MFVKLHNGITVFIITLLGLSFTSCGNDNQHNNGYEAAWEGKEPSSSLWSNSKFKEGYEQGSDDAHMYDEGYYDGKNGKKPKYLNDEFYLDGFKDGKN